MDCLEKPDDLAPRHDCRCGCCCRARENSVPAKLRAMCHRATSLHSPLMISDTIIHRAISAYIAGYIGLSEMQIELIVALANQVDEQFQKQLSEAALRPLILTK